MKKVNEVSKLAGVTKRTLQYYDNEGLVSVNRSKENYRLYDEDSLEKIWEILIFRSMGFGLDEIKKVQRMSRKQQENLLQQRLEILMKEVESLERQLKFISAMKEYGIPPICFEENSSYISYVDFINVFKEIFGGEMIKKESIKVSIELSERFKQWMEEHCTKEMYDCLLDRIERYLK